MLKLVIKFNFLIIYIHFYNRSATTVYTLVEVSVTSIALATGIVKFFVHSMYGSDGADGKTSIH